MAPRRRGTGPGRLGEHEWTVQEATSVRVYASRMHCRIASCVLVSPLAGRSNAKLRRSPFTEYLPSRKRHVSPSIATFPHTEADESQSAERSAIGSEDHLRVSQLPLGIAALIRKDLYRHHFAIAFGHDGPP